MGLIMGSIISLSVIISFICLYAFAEKLFNRIRIIIKKSTSWEKFNDFGKKY